MKGTILVCLREMLTDTKGVSAADWREMTAAAGLAPEKGVITAFSDVEDSIAVGIFGQAQQRFFNSHIELADAFGHFWCVTYAPRVYPSTCNRFSNARDFIAGMDAVHVMVTQSIKNSSPPRFTYESIGSNRLRVHYQSKRGLIHIFAGLCRGVGAYFGEQMKVEVLSDTALEIEFGAKT
ncbi:MAG: heme NO-binding domain-containing protein [Moraxellaceae bacterium]|nr:heme NO-binding domain-containing protein [Moraxellaceae bacterium]